MKGRKLIVILASIALAVATWILFNPPRRFGLSRFGITTYSCIPVPIVDFQVRGDGAVRWVRKTHDLDAQALAWLLAPDSPDVLIVALGWSSETPPPRKVGALASTQVFMVSTEEALPLYNTLKRRGLRVAIHVHSTC